MCSKQQACMILFETGVFKCAYYFFLLSFFPSFSLLMLLLLYVYKLLLLEGFDFFRT
jgi:hypothetical protein